MTPQFNLRIYAVMATAIFIFGSPILSNSLHTRIINIDNLTGTGYKWTPSLQPKDLEHAHSFYCKHKEYEGQTLYWNAKWWPETTDEPGTLSDSGIYSAWEMINSKNFYGDSISWVGWNSDAPITVISSRNWFSKTVNTVGTTGDQLDRAAPGVYVPTWRDGAEGAINQFTLKSIKESQIYLPITLHQGSTLSL